jgi:hypothetical protein
MHDLLFANQPSLEDVTFVKHAGTLGLNVSSFEQCLRAGQRDAVEAVRSAADAFAISGTPAVFVGRFLPDGRVKVGERWTGWRPEAFVGDVLNRALASPRSLSLDKRDLPGPPAN